MAEVQIKATQIVRPSEKTWTGRMTLTEIDVGLAKGFVPKLYLYSPNKAFDAASISQTLKESLGKALVHFYPFAGRLTPTEGGRWDLVVDDAANTWGVPFVEAETNVEVAELGDDLLEAEANGRFRNLYSMVDYGKPLQELPLLMVKITHFRCGGVGVAITWSHAVVDGLGAGHFYSEWCRLARGEPLGTAPVHDRSLLGWIDDKLKSGSKTVVAIKKLNSESLQGFEQWQSEINFLGSLSHPHLVRLLGYCWDDKELLIVYEYLAKGSLENHLFRKSVEPLAWDRRISIALGAARGLSFLHSLDNEVIYRDFKASNILLDGNYNAKLSDFGLAKFGPSGDKSHVTTRVMGTMGYAAPEYVATGHLYVKSDVYGFGVVLLELLTGLRALDPNRPNGQKSLVDWARPSLSNKKKVNSVMDGRLNGQYSIKAAQEAGQLTAKCLRPDPRARPSMKEVVDALQQIESMRDIRSSSSKSSDRGSGRVSSRRSGQGSGTELGGLKFEPV